MARVFVSYRRADGLYGVGWLAERLRSLDSITGVETAFHDAALRAGDDFPDALEAEIAGSDLVVAVVGPAWWGRRDSGPSRIEDPDDWVVREIATAFEQGTVVVPVLLGGADHPLASEVHPSIADLARLHALPFHDGRDLDTIIDHIESHLADLDRDRARLAGLEEPVEVPRLDHLPALVAGAVVAALIGAGLALVSLFAGVPSDADLRSASSYTTAYAPALVALGLAVGAFGVFGFAVARRLLAHVDVGWSRVVPTFVAAAGMAAVMVYVAPSGHLYLDESPSIPYGAWRGWSNFVASVLAVAPWALCMAAPMFGEVRAADHELGRRIQVLALMRDAERWGAISIASILTLGTVVDAAMVAAGLQSGEVDRFEPVPLIGFAALVSLVVMFAHAAVITRLRDRQAELERPLASLPPRYRANALPRLVATTFDDGGWGFRAVLAAPMIVAIVASIAIAATVA